MGYAALRASTLKAFVCELAPSCARSKLTTLRLQDVYLLLGSYGFWLCVVSKVDEVVHADVADVRQRKA